MGSSGVRLGAHEGGEREVPWKSKECGEEGLGVELEVYDRPLLEHQLGGLFCGENLVRVDRKKLA